MIFLYYCSGKDCTLNAMENDIAVDFTEKALRLSESEYQEFWLTKIIPNKYRDEIPANHGITFSANLDTVLDEGALVENFLKLQMQDKVSNLDTVLTKVNMYLSK